MFGERRETRMQVQSSEERDRAEEMLRRIAVGREVGAIKFSGSPVLVLKSRGKEPPDLHALLRVDSGWSFTEAGPAAGADDRAPLPERPIEELAVAAIRVRWSPIRWLRLGREAPHLVIEFESGATLVVSGESWELSWAGCTVESLPRGAGVSVRWRAADPDPGAATNRSGS
jgi:hypothetical protein